MTSTADMAARVDALEAALAERQRKEAEALTAAVEEHAALFAELMKDR